MARQAAPRQPSSLRSGSVGVAQRDGGQDHRDEKEHASDVTKGNNPFDVGQGKGDNAIYAPLITHPKKATA